MRRLRRRRMPKTQYQEALKELKQVFLSDDFPQNPVVDIHQYFNLSQQALGEYVTLDWIHKQEIGRTIFLGPGILVYIIPEKFGDLRLWIRFSGGRTRCANRTDEMQILSGYRYLVTAAGLNSLRIRL